MADVWRDLYLWHMHLKEAGATISIEELGELYDAHYTCRCESCIQRKMLGYQPLPITDKCSAPHARPKLPSWVQREIARFNPHPNPDRFPEGAD